MRTRPSTCYQCGSAIPPVASSLRLRQKGFRITQVSVECRRGHLNPVRIEDE